MKPGACPFAGAGPAFRRLGQVVAALAAFGTWPALACTCEGDDNPANLRATVEIVIEGEVLGIEELPSRLEALTRATIRITAKPRGARLPEVLRVDTAASTENCGYRFRRGEKREFLIRRFGSRLVTTACLMQAAKGPSEPAPQPFEAQAATP